jgi:hypothetical protein
MAVWPNSPVLMPLGGLLDRMSNQIPLGRRNEKKPNLSS